MLRNSFVHAFRRTPTRHSSSEQSTFMASGYKKGWGDRASLRHMVVTHDPFLRLSSCTLPDAMRKRRLSESPAKHGPTQRTFTYSSLLPMARTLVLYHPMMFSNTSNFPQRSIPLCQSQRRWLNSNGTKDKDAEPKKPEGSSSESKKEAEGVTEEHKSNRSLASIVGSVGPTLRKVVEWNTGDLVAVYAIFLLITIILSFPTVAGQMKVSRTIYGVLDADDPVTNILMTMQQDAHENDEQSDDEVKAELDSEGRKSAGNTIDMFADILKSETLQDAIASLINRVLESKQFQKACQALLKNLWNDLVYDPETTAQVVQLLNNAIQNKDIQRSVKKLVLQIIEDQEVYDELTRLVVRLGQEKEVLDAIQSLLTTSAHNALNDPEILDHSMEFATDVVGDDIVQRTSGEALRNTVTYAVGPGVSAFLAVVGMGLIIFSISALSNARATEQESAVVDKALTSMAQSLQASTRDGLAALTSLPGRFLSSCGSLLVSVVMFPIRLAQQLVSRMERAGNASATAFASAVYFIAALPAALMNATFSLFGRVGRSFTDGVSYSAGRMMNAVSASFVGSAARAVAYTGGQALSMVSNSFSWICRVMASGRSATGNVVSAIGESVSNGIAASTLALVSLLNGGGRIMRNAATGVGGGIASCGSFLGSVVVGATSLVTSAAERSSLAVSGVNKLILQLGQSITTSVSTVVSWLLRLVRRDTNGGRGTSPL